MRCMKSPHRLAILAAVAGLALVCLTVLAALQVVDGDRVVDVIAAAVPAFLGGLLGARNGHDGRSLRPPPVPVQYPDERRRA